MNTDQEIDARHIITSVQRAGDVLLLFTRSDAETLGVTEISEALDISKAVVHRILATLRSRGFIESDPQTRRYRLGTSVFALGMRYLDQVDLRSATKESMARLVERTNETATLSVRAGWVRIYLDQVTPLREVKMTVPLGRPFPLHAGSSSKAMLAFMPADEIQEYLDTNHEAMTDRTITDSAELAAELQRIRRQGYATSFGERDPSSASVAAPILNKEGTVEAVISVCGPSQRFLDVVDEFIPLLLLETQTISRRLGYLTHQT